MLLKHLDFIKNTGAQTLIVIILYLFLAEFIPVNIQRLFFTISLTIKDLLIAIMPIAIAAFIGSAIYSFKDKALLFIILIVLFEAISNLICVWYSFGTAKLVANHFYNFKITNSEIGFEPLWHSNFNKPSWWTPDKGLLAGAILGYLSILKHNYYLVNFVEKTKNLVNYCFSKILAKIMPIFILGFIIQAYQLGLLGHIFINYTSLIITLVFGLILYIFILFLMGSDFNIKTITRHISNLLPAAGIALTSGCSLSTMPFTINGTSKNLIKPELAGIIIPATTNIQQVGDIFTNCFLCFLIYYNFFGVSPDFTTCLSFSLIFVATRFATLGVRGGAIYLMIPIYEKYLHFSPEMIAIILALNVVLDPIITSANVIANGALCKVFEKIWLKY